MSHTKHIALWLLVCFVAACGGGGGGGGSSAEPASAGTPPPATQQPPQQAPPVTPVSGTQIHVLALASQGVAQQFVDVDLRVQHLFNTANDTLRASGVDLEFVLTQLEMVDYPDGYPIEQALDDVTYASHPALADVAQLRDANQADLVVLLRPYANDGHCGYAWIGAYQQQGDFSHPAEPDFGFSVVAANCSDYILLHELGHNLGLAHSRLEDPQGGTHAWSTGYGVPQEFVTVMASPTEFNAPRLPVLSSPALTCAGQPCGVPHTQAEGADAVRSLNAVKSQVAAYR